MIRGTELGCRGDWVHLCAGPRSNGDTSAENKTEVELTGLRLESEEKQRKGNSPYLASIALALCISFVPLQVSLFQGETTQPAAQWEEEDGEWSRGRAKTPQRVEES